MQQVFLIRLALYSTVSEVECKIHVKHKEAVSIR